MAVMNLESLVLRGVRVLNDVRMVLERNGSHPVVGAPSAVSLSFARHLSDPQTETDAGTRWPAICLTNGKATANRAGRSGCSAGVLSRCTARFAAQAVPSGRRSVRGLGRGLPAMPGLTGSPAGMHRPLMNGSLICSPLSSVAKKRIPPVRPQLQQPYPGNFTTY